MRAARALRVASGAAAATSSAAAATYHLRRDAVLKVWTPHLRLVLVTATRTANEAVRRHGVASPAAAALLAKTTAGAALLSASLKGEERAILQLVDHEGGGRRLYAEAMAVGEVRAYAAPAAAADWPARLPPAPSSSLSVTSILYGSAAPHQSVVGCTAGDVGGDLTEYFRRSAQVPSHVLLEAELAADGDSTTDGSGASQLPRLSFVGGLLVQRIARGGGSQPRLELLAAQADDEVDGDNPDGAATKWSSLEDVKAALAAASAGGSGSNTARLLGALLSDGREDDEQPGAAADDGVDASAGAAAVPSAATAALTHPFSLAECARRGMALPAVARALLPELEGLLPPDAGMIGSGGGGAADETSALSSASGVGMARVPLDFYCRCSKDGFLAKLGRSSSPDLLRDLLRQGTDAESSSSNDSVAPLQQPSPPSPPPTSAASAAAAAGDDRVCTSLTCQFCNTDYPVTAGDLAGLLAERALVEAA